MKETRQYYLIRKAHRKYYKSVLEIWFNRLGKIGSVRASMYVEVEVELPLQKGDPFWRLMPFRRRVSGGSVMLFPRTAHPDSSRTWSL